VDDLLVIKVAKELCLCVFQVTQRSPKSARFTFVSRLQNTALDILESVFLANGCYIGPGGLPQDAQQRRSLQQRAMTRAQLLAYLAEMASTENVILPQQFERIGRLTTSCQRLVGGWIASDRQRVPTSMTISGEGARGS